MKSVYSCGLCAAGVLTFNMAVFAQSTQQPPATDPAAGAPQEKAADQQVTVTGCVQREADYRRAMDAGKGGVAGTGVGAGNEFVLINASLSPGAAEAPVGTSGAAAITTAYELTGSSEGQAEQHVGRRVEISGKLKAADVSASGRPTGGATAGTPPGGIDVASKDLKLRELEMTSIKEVPGTCPAK